MICYDELIEFIDLNIEEFHEKRLEKLSKIDMKKLIKRKNPYLFKAKNVQTCEELVKNYVDATLSSSEETLFGEFVEKLAIYVAGKTCGGVKSSAKGIDLEFERDGIRYIVSIKSGPNWGNSGQIADMKNNFDMAKKILRTQNSTIQVEAVNGCCYGDKNEIKGNYQKLCGQSFWEFISNDPDFYVKIIEPIGYKAREKNEKYWTKYGCIINTLTRSFMEVYCKPDGSINWEQLVMTNSMKK